MEQRAELLTVTQQLIRFQTVAHNHEEIKACVAYVRQFFSGTSIHIAEHTFKGNPALFISLDGKRKQDIILNGHLDVVAGASTQFNPQIKDGKLYGRGANDMKGAVAAFMLLMKQYANKRSKPKVGLMLVCDEETGGYSTRMMIKAGYTCNFAIAGEPTRFHIETKHKGILAVKVTAYGSHSHGSRPWQGVNAVDKLIRKYHRLIEEIPQATTSRKWLPTINISSIHAEGPYNVTPAKASMILDIRTTEEFTNRKMRSLLKSKGMKHEIIVDGSMLLNPVKSPPIRLLRKIAREKLKRRIAYVKSCGSSDMRFFSERGITAVNFGPFGKNHHKNNEYVETASLHAYYTVLETFLEEYTLVRNKMHVKNVKKRKIARK